jgi:hypothetical protein
MEGVCLLKRYDRKWTKGQLSAPLEYTGLYSDLVQQPGVVLRDDRPSLALMFRNREITVSIVGPGHQLNSYSEVSSVRSLTF